MNTASFFYPAAGVYVGTLSLRCRSYIAFIVFAHIAGTVYTILVDYVTLFNWFIMPAFSRCAKGQHIGGGAFNALHFSSKDSMWQPPPPRVRMRNSTWNCLSVDFGHAVTVVIWVPVLCLFLNVDKYPVLVIPAVVATAVATVVTIARVRRLWRQFDNSRRRRTEHGERTVAETLTLADKAWRRRSWLVVLRAREQVPAVEASLCSPFAALGRFLTGNCRIRQRPPRRLELAVIGSDLEDSCAAEERDLQVLVLNLVRMEEEGLFREIVLFV